MIAGQRGVLGITGDEQKAGCTKLISWSWLGWRYRQDNGGHGKRAGEVIAGQP